MGGGLVVADDFTADHSDMDLSEFLMVSKPSSEDGSVSEVSTCDLSLKQKPARQVAEDSKTNTLEFPMVTESSPENVSVSEVTCDLGLQQKPARTLVLLGRSGNGKSATGNSILGRQAFKSKARASGVTKACELQSSTLPNGQILNVIDTPGLFSMSPSTEFTCREILRCLSLCKEGIDAVLVVFSLKNRLTEEEKSALFALKILFGSQIVDYMIVVFTNEDALEDDGETLEDYLNDCSDFKEIIEACNDRKVLFGNRAKAPESQKAKQVQELLNYVEEIAKENGKPYMGDLSHEIRENETAFQEKQRQILEMKGGFVTKQEMSQMMKNMVKFYENQLVSQMIEKVESKLRETQKMLEQQLNEEKVARLEWQKKANEVEKHSSNEVKKLREELERAKKMTKELQEKKHCIIL